MTKMTGQISEYLKNERDFNMKSKAFSITFFVSHSRMDGDKNVSTKEHFYIKKMLSLHTLLSKKEVYAFHFVEVILIVENHSIFGLYL